MSEAHEGSVELDSGPPQTWWTSADAWGRLVWGDGEVTVLAHPPLPREGELVHMSTSEFGPRCLTRVVAVNEGGDGVRPTMTLRWVSGGDGE